MLDACKFLLASERPGNNRHGSKGTPFTATTGKAKANLRATRIAEKYSHFRTLCWASSQFTP